ncbi:MAG: glutamate:protein symporter [Bacillota bacterium]|nr:glutamate:protein symporter [Bacillota bacterium]
MKWWFKQQLYVKIFICIIVGAILGFTLGDTATAVLKPIGDVFIRLLKMLIVPVIFFTVVSGITKMEDVKSLRSVGGKLIVYYVITSLLAAVIGLVMALIIKPGSVSVTGLIAETAKVEINEFNIVETLISWVPTNPFEAFVNANVLQILFFSVIFGMSLLLLREKVKKLNEVLDQCAEAMIKVTDIVMQFSPYGILALIATMVNSLSLGTLAEVGKFILADYLAIIIILLVVYPLQLKFSKINPIKFYKAASPAVIIAASTTSSAATLPVSLNVAEKSLKIPEKIYGFGLTVGATINTNGMAAAIGVIGVFACNIYDVPITIPMMFQIIFLGLMLSMGAAGVKGAGIVLSATLLQTLGLPLELVSIFAAIWPVIDIAHTTANVVGDLVGVSIIASNAGEMNVDEFNKSVITNA